MTKSREHLSDRHLALNSYSDSRGGSLAFMEHLEEPDLVLGAFYVCLSFVTTL